MNNSRSQGKALGKRLSRSTPYIDLYREAPIERGSFFRLQAYTEKVGISQVEEYEREEKSVIYLFQRDFN